MPEGRIVKSLSGFYYVQDQQDGQIIQCRARGVFKKRGVHPLVGDEVQYERVDEQDGTVTHVYERRNELTRPPVANVDQALLVFSIDEPQISTLLLDRLLIHVEREGIHPIICLSKIDLNGASLQHQIDIETYKHMGYQVILTSSVEHEGIGQIAACMRDKVTVLSGQSGVGKSSLLNAIDPQFDLETKTISTRLGRGRHTTRHVELLPLPDGGWVIDTPGFSQLDFQGLDVAELSGWFRDFERYVAECKFRSCVHTNEPGCAVIQAWQEGLIAEHRYTNYLKFLDELNSTIK